MALWGSIDQANNAPKSTVSGGISANAQALFGNVLLSAYQTGSAVGVFGVDTTETGITTGDGKKVQHAGWNLRIAGSGPVVTIAANTGSYSPDGNVFLTFTGGGTGNTTANARVVTNGSKLITGITVLEGGQYLTTPTAAAVNANATFSITMGGRANRVSYETLVAMGSMSGDAADDTIFPDS